MKAYALALLLVGLPSLPLGATQAVTVEGAEFPETVTVDDRVLTLAGTGVATYRLVFTVYAAALYVPAGTTRDEVLDGGTLRRLTIEYFHDIDRQSLIEAGNEVLARQLDAARRADVNEAAERFHGFYRSVTAGDRCTMTYRPGQGTTLALNGERLGTVAGAGFAATYFGIWLDRQSLSKTLRQGLMQRLPGR